MRVTSTGDRVRNLRSIRGTNDERGGVTIIVAVVVAMGVAFGMMALSLDVGQMMMERRQLQNGADAAALYLAHYCADATVSAGGNSCSVTSGTADTTSRKLIGDNSSTKSNDDSTSGSLRCFYNPPAGITFTNDPGCPGSPTNSGAFADCGPLTPYVASGAPLVQVYTKSKAASGAGASSLRNWIAPLVGGSKDSKVGSCARAAWGSSDGGGDLPITISACDWRSATGGNDGGGGGTFWPMPNYTLYPTITVGPAGHPVTYPAGYGALNPWPAAVTTPNTPGHEVVMILQGNGNFTSPDCAAPPSSTSWEGHALPGGFGVLDTVAGQPCQAIVYPFNWYSGHNGNNTSCNLEALIGTVVSIPVFDCTNNTLLNRLPIYPPTPGADSCTAGNGTNAYYHRQGRASFYISGYRFNVTGGITNEVDSIRPGSTGAPCGGGQRCLSGWFVSGELDGGAIDGPPGGPDSFGGYTVRTAG